MMFLKVALITIRRVLMKKDITNGIYFIDDDYKILHYNNVFKEMYPEAEKGRRCYEMLARRSDPCPHCPINNKGKLSSFYNTFRHEWIQAQAADIDVPGLGNCRSVIFTRTPESESSFIGDSSPADKKAAIDYLGDNDRTGMIGGYCEDDFPLYFVNDKMIKMLGYDDYDDLRNGIGGLVSNTIHPDDIAQVIEDIGSSYYEGLEYETIYRMSRKDGTWFWTANKGRVIEAEDGRLAIVSFCTDITNLLREQQYIHLLDSMQNEILDSISCGVFAYTLDDYKLLTVNNAAKKMIGCGQDEDPIESLYSFMSEKIHPDDREYVTQAKKLVKNPGDTLLQDYRAIVNGKKKYLHSNIKCLENTKGHPYVLITLLDTTEQSILTNTLKNERKTYRDALANGSEFSFFFDLTDGLIPEEFITAHGVNLIKRMGFTAPADYDALLAEYTKRCNIEFASPDMEKNFTCKGLLEAYENGITNVITEYYNPENDLFLRVNCLLALDDETGHVHASVVADNITEIRKNEKTQREALKAANEEMNVRINAILDGISGGLKIVDVENDYCYDYISEGAAQLQGYSVDEFLKKFGKRVTSNIYGDEGEPALAEANRQIAEKGSYSVRYRVPHKDGSIKWVIDRGKYIVDPNTGRKFLYILMQDITDLEERNTQISNVLMMQKHMADSIGNGIFAYTLPERRVLLLNQETRRMFNCTDSDEGDYGMDIVSKIIPDDLPAMREAVRHLKKPGDNIEFIFHSDTISNERRTFKCTTKLLSFEKGQQYIISAITDITKQELTEKRIAEERSQYRNALAYSSDSIFTIDLTDGFLYDCVYNKSGKSLFEPLGIQYPVHYDVLAEAWFSDKRIVTDSTKIKHLRSSQALIEFYNSGNSIIDVEYHIPIGGKYYHIVILLYTIDGHIKANFVIYDITSDRHEEKQKRAIIDSLGKMYLALYHLSLTDNNITILKINSDIGADVSDKCSIDEFTSLYTEKYVLPEYKASIVEFLDVNNIKEALRNVNFTSIEFKRKDLGWCRVSLVAAERDKSGEVVSVVFAGNIIEKQKLAELAQREALMAACESANIANSAKTDFLANMSHDIRTPMNAIIGMTAIAGTHLDDKERLSDCLSKISLASKHLLGIINEVLDMSKIESGKMELHEEEFNLAELIDNLLTMSRTEISAKYHELTVNIRNIEHEKVIGDSQRIQQVFMNLMSNAIKYTPEYGKIRLTVSEKTTNKNHIGCYEFIFEDNGIGMSKDFLDHIFEPFARATHDSRIDKIQGTGLGMPITKSIIQMMNGNINVESKLNEGTKITVTFFLRLKSTDQNNSYENLIDLPILVADDDEDSCIYTCQILDEIGMNGEWVLTGHEAVERTVKHHEESNDFFAIILDWKMAGMDGVETTREIRKKVGKDVPIIIISAFDWNDIELEARAAGANAFISKPLFKSRIVHLFNEILDGGKNEKSASDLDALKNEDFSGKRALLVEDNPLNAEIAGEILEMAGLEIEYALNGKEAVDIMTNAEDGYFDVVFMDIQMPIMNGYEAARAIRALPRNYTKSVPILAMTANAFAEDVAAAKNAGMNEHIAKPIDFEQLTITLKKWLV